MRFRGGQLLITTGAPYGEGTNSQQNNTQNTPLTLDNPHIHTPGMILCISSTAGHAHTACMHRTVFVCRSTVLRDHASMCA